MGGGRWVGQVDAQEGALIWHKGQVSGRNLIIMLVFIIHECSTYSLLHLRCAQCGSVHTVCAGNGPTSTEANVGQPCLYNLNNRGLSATCMSSPSQEDLPIGPMECEAQQHPTASGPHCVVEFSFEAEGTGELFMCKGDVVELLKRVGGDWLRGQLAGKEGSLPTNLVKIIEDLPPRGGAGSGMDTPTLGPNVAMELWQT